MTKPRLTHPGPAHFDARVASNHRVEELHRDWCGHTVTLEGSDVIAPSLGHDFYPYTWGIFLPALVDSTITIGSFGFFFLLFLGFIKLMPAMSIAEVKETLPWP